MRINSIEFRNKKKIEKTNSSYQIVDVNFEIGEQQFTYSFGVFGDNELELLPKIKREVGNYLVNQLFKNYDAMTEIKK